MNIAIVGSRELTISTAELEKYIPENADTIISGGAVGIDSTAALYAKEMKVPRVEIKPDYKRYGRAAPIIRNREIVTKADKVIIIWNGVSKGTQNVIEECKKHGKEYVVYML